MIRFLSKNIFSLLGILVFVFFCLLSNTSFANNLAISNVTLSGFDPTNNLCDAQFDISWDNSWLNSTNYDAVWLFMKYSTDSGSTWHHATLAASTNHSIGTGVPVSFSQPSDNKGVFLKRSTAGVGTVSVTGAKLCWNYGADGVSDSASVRVKVLGIEMVYVPEGSFYAGDNANSTSSFKQGSSDTRPWHITNNSAISVTNCASGGFYYTTDPTGNDDATGSAFTIPASFPKGYSAFYIMKYEVTEGQWVDFFNTLTAGQKANLDITDSVGKNSDSVVNRNTVSCINGTATTDRANRACGYLGYPDLAAYADWAALRPITELEYEKACRGPSTAVSGEYAWGSTEASQALVISGGATQVNRPDDYGGTITHSGGYTIHKFTSSGTYHANSNHNVEVLVVGGGGGGGGTYQAGGGGGGGVVYNSSFAVTTGDITVTVGAGGAGGLGTDYGHVGSNGNNSVFSSLTAYGGGGGGAYGGGIGQNGGCGGGGASQANEAGGTGSQGGAGGTGESTDVGAGGGGGAAPDNGDNGITVTGHGGNGGDGYSSSISGSSQVYGGGGGGMGSVQGGLGTGGGGNGATYCSGAGGGTANTGGGGGGQGYCPPQTGGSGGSGIVIIKYLTGTENT